MSISNKVKIIDDVITREVEFADEPTDDIQDAWFDIKEALGMYHGYYLGNKEDTDPPAAESVATSRKCVPIANIKQILAEQTVSTALLGPHREELRKMLEDSMRDHSKQEDTDSPAAEENCAFDWTRRGCVDCDD